MVVLCRPNWVKSPQGTKLEHLTSEELRAEILALNLEGLGSDLPTADLVLRWMQHLVSVIDESGMAPGPAVAAYLKTINEELAA